MTENEILSVLMPERTKQIGLAWSILRESQLAEDAYQDMMVKVFENKSGFDGAKHLRDWSWKVLRNRCYEIIRKGKNRPMLLDSSVLDLVDADLESRDSKDLESQANALRNCLGQLTANARNVVRLRYFEGLRGNEVAEQLGRKPDAIYKALQRIYTTLGKCIRVKLEQESGAAK